MLYGASFDMVLKKTGKTWLFFILVVQHYTIDLFFKDLWMDHLFIFEPDKRICMQAAPVSTTKMTRISVTFL